jgi:hypothetical protein
MLIWFMVFNATFNNISAISWWTVLLVEEIGVLGENHWPVTSHWQTSSHNFVLSTPRHYQKIIHLIWSMLKYRGFISIIVVVSTAMLYVKSNVKTCWSPNELWFPITSRLIYNDTFLLKALCIRMDNLVCYQRDLYLSMDQIKWIIFW